MANKPQTSPDSDTIANQSALRHGIHTQWLMLVLGLVILAGVFGYQSFSTHREITDQEQRRLQTQARVIASNIEGQLEATNMALTSAMKDVSFPLGPEETKLINRSLQALTDAMPGIRTMFVLDAAGTMVASNREELIGRNFRTRDYFAIPARDKNPATFYLSPPFKTVLGSFLINVSRVIATPDGTFQGVISAALDPEYFRVLLSSVLYAPDMSSAITHGDGISFMSLPVQEGQSGKNLAGPGTFYTRHRASGRQESVLTGKSPDYGGERVVALHTIQPQKLMSDKPLYVDCSRDYAAIYENWRSNTFKQAVAFVIIAISAGSGMMLFQRRQRELALGEQERVKLGIRYQTLLSVSSDGIYILDQDGNLVESNAAFRQMLGYSADDEPRLHVSDWVDGLPPEGLTARIRDLIHAPAIFETRHRRRDGSIFDAEVNACGVQLDGIWYLYASSRDVSRRKEMEADLARSNRELELFAFVASHDLQEPLRKIAGFTELLARRYRGSFDEKAESYMAYIVDGATRMRTLINDLLSYSRVMRGDRELAETDCSAVLSKVIRDLELTIRESGAEIVSGTLPVIRADRSQLGRLFQNLISNAIKYRASAPPRIRIQAVRQGNNWLFSVADNGIGIDREFYERIFVIFQRLHSRNEYSGTGIGLAICQKIVERHGGTIWVESTPGSGSTFFFTLPILGTERSEVKT